MAGGINRGIREAGKLCVLSCGLGENRDVFFPNLAQGLDEKTFADIARDLLVELGYKPAECGSEAEAKAQSGKRRAQSGERFALPASRLAQGWPCYLFKSDTTGEKEFEEFFAQGERLVLDRFWPQSGSEDVRRPGGGGLRTEDGRRGTRLEALETLCHTIGSKLGKMMQKPDSFS